MSQVLDRPAAPLATGTPTPGLTGPYGRRRPVPWRWLAVLATGLALFAAVSGTLVTTHDPVFLPTLLLLGAAVAPATLTTLVTEVEGFSSLTLGRVLACAVLGGVAGGVLAGLLEFDTQRTLGSVPYLMIGLIEESAKLAIPVALFAWGRSRGRALDGLVLGVAAGSGFAALETAGYGFVALVEARGNLLPVEHLLVVRALASLGSHAAWTGLAAAAWFAISTARRRWVGWVRFLAIFAAVICLHAQWDASVSTGQFRYLAGFSFAALVATVAWLSARSSSRRHQAPVAR